MIRVDIANPDVRAAVQGWIVDVHSDDRFVFLNEAVNARGATSVALSASEFFDLCSWILAEQYRIAVKAASMARVEKLVRASTEEEP